MGEEARIDPEYVVQLPHAPGPLEKQAHRAEADIVSEELEQARAVIEAEVPYHLGQ